MALMLGVNLIPPSFAVFIEICRKKHQIFCQGPLTYNTERDKVAAHWLGRNLAFIDSGVPFLGPLYLQRPVVDVFVMRRLESLVGCVRVAADGEYVNVPVPYPRNLPIPTGNHESSDPSERYPISEPQQ